ITSNGSFTLGSGVGVDVGVRFAPTTTGTVNGTITIAAPSCNLTVSVTGNGTVSEPFSLAASPATQAILPGFATSYTVTATLVEGPATDAAITVSGCPTGSPCGSSPTHITTHNKTGSAGFTAGAMPAGADPLTITATGGGTTKASPLTRVVKNLQFTLTAAPATQTILPGFATGYTVTATLVDQGTTPASTDVAFTVSGCPTGASCGFSPTHFTPTNSTDCYVTTPGSSHAATSPLTITAKDGGTTKAT